MMRRLTTLLDALPARTGLRIRQRALLYGFSRGGQVAHRFALAYPQRVLGVATLAAGAYTLPVGEMTIDGQRRPLPLPYGTADLAQRLGEPVDPAALRRVAFWVAVGGNDSRDRDVPMAWTAYIGPNRLARARAFKAALDRMGVPATLAIFPGVDHREVPEMRAAATAFLQGLAPDEALVPPRPARSPPPRTRAAAQPALA
jgi:pimeloyl-ACP methyl ester carboxylesterase